MRNSHYYRRRHRYNRYGEPPPPDYGILLEEFRFHNKQKKIIEDSVLVNLKKNLLDGTKSQIYWTNDMFAKFGIGFTLSKVSNFDKDQKLTYYSIYIKIMEFGFTFTSNQFNSCKKIWHDLFVTYDMPQEDIDFIDGLDILPSDDYNYHDDDKLKKKLGTTINSWNDLINYLIKDNHLLGYSTQNEFKEYKNQIKKLFDIELKERKYNIIRHNYSDNGHHIIKVIEKRIDNKNYRIAFIAKINHDTYPTFDILNINEDDDDYNYIDENRIYIKGDNTTSKKYFLDMSLVETEEDGTIIMDCDLYKEIIKNINEILNDDQKIITPQIYRFYKERVTRWDSSGNYLTEKERKIVEQYKKVLKAKGNVKVGDVLISENSIEVSGEIFKITFNKEFLDTYEQFVAIKNALKVGDVRYNFNSFFDNILKISCLKVIRMDNTKESDYKNFKETSFTLNGMKITIKKESNRIKINDYYCRISDIQHILSRAICCKTLDDFNKYVKDVSFIGVEWKMMISNGIAVTLTNPLTNLYQKIDNEYNESMYIRFSLLWDDKKRSKIYLLLNGTKYLIRYKQKFKQIFNFPNRQIDMSKLKKELTESLYDINDEIIIEIVENAVEEAKIITKRGKELVENTIKDIHAVPNEIDLRGTIMKGYKFKGRISGKEYFVNKLDLTVWRLENGNWDRRCVVDDHTKQRIFEDRLANRLINIYNEPAFISTL